MIDEKKLIEDIKNLIDSEELAGHSPGSVLHSVCEKVWEQPKVGEWIPVSERLPENFTPVNITWVNRKPGSYYMHIKDKPFTATGILYCGEGYWWSVCCEDYLREYGNSEADAMHESIEVVAWMPLPEPYKEEVQNDKF